MLRLEVRNAETPIEKKPEWIKTRAKMGPEYNELMKLVKGEGLHTVCQEAGCPNIFECWEDREATFLIGGDQCTRRCDFCQIDTGKPDAARPRRAAPRRRVRPEDGAALRHRHRGRPRRPAPTAAPGSTPRRSARSTSSTPAPASRCLIPDFNGVPDLLEQVFDAAPEVFAHNIETVPRIFRRIRPGFRYERSLDVITQARDVGLVTKSNLILGMGETRDEVSQALATCTRPAPTCITITQYLRPSRAAPPGRALGQARGVRGARDRG